MNIGAEHYGLKLPKSRIRKKKKKDDPYEYPTAMAEEIMAQYIFVTPTDTEELYIYKNGIYEPLGEIYVKEKVVEADSEKSSFYAREAIHQIKSRTYIPRNKFNAFPNILHLKNGIFNLEDNTLSQFTSDIISTISIPIEYKKDADCPKIKKFVSEIVHGDDINIIQELFGYCLLRDYPIQKSFMFIGEGANGKSTILELLRLFIGRENTTSVPLQDIDISRFAMASLYGKLANIYADLPDKALEQTGKFKTLTGGDSVQAELKFKASFNFTNYAKLIFSTNKIPQSKDRTDAFFRRWIILNFPNTFEGTRADKQLIKKLTISEELSGLFNWAIEGLNRLLANGCFTYSYSTEEIRKEYERMSSPLHAFVQDCLEINVESWISKEELYLTYVKYCKDNKLPATAKNVVGREISRYINIRDEKQTIAGKRATGWRGVRFQGTENEEYPEEDSEEDSQEDYSGRIDEYDD